MYYWIWFAHILLRIFTSMLIRNIGLSFSLFFVVSLSGFCIVVMETLKNEFGRLSLLFSFFFLNCVRRGINPSLNVW